MSNLDATINVGLDGSKVSEGIAPIVKNLENLGKTAKKAGQDASDGISKIGDGGEKSAAKIDASTKSIINSLQRKIAATEAAGQGERAYQEILAKQRGVDLNVIKPYLDQLDAIKIKQAEATKAMLSGGGALKNVEMSAAATANALRGVPAQFTDIVTSIQGGQKPLTVFLQQGGQLKDMFGGAGNAAKALGGYVAGLINPFTIAAAAVGGLGAAYFYGAEQSKRLNNALIVTGNLAGLTGSKLNSIAESVGAATGKYSEAREAVASLAEAGTFSASAIGRLSGAIVAGANLTGKSVSDMVDDFAKIQKDPIKGLDELNLKYNFLTAGIRESIKALVEQGKTQQAVNLGMDAYADAIKSRNGEVVKNIGYIEQAWKAVAKESAAALDTAFSIGRDKTLDEKIAIAKNQLASMRQTAGNVLPDSGAAREIADKEKLIAAYEKEVKVSSDVAEAQGKIAREQKKAAEQAGNLEKYINNDKHLTRVQALAEEEKAFTKATEGYSKGSKEYQQAADANAMATKKINDQFKDKGASSHVDKEANAYQTLIKSIREKVAASELELLGAKPLTEAQKETIKVNELVAISKKKGIVLNVEEARAQLEILSATDKLVISQKQSAEEHQKYIDSLEKGNDALVAQVKAQEEYNARIGLGKEEIAALDAAEMEHQATTADSIALTMDMIDWSGQLGDAYRKQAKELRNLAALKVTGAAKQVSFDLGKKAQDDLDKFLDPTKAQTFGEALKGAFGGAGDALGKLTNSLQAYGIKEAQIAKARTDASLAYKDDANKLAEVNAQITDKETAARIGSYGDIADAASGFFDKQSSGYKALQTTAQIFHAAELALTLGGLAAKGISAVLTQGKGDPYTAFGRMAAMAAIVGGLGVAIGGVGGGSSGSGVSSADAQKTQGTGGAFGDASKKSDSIAKAIELTAKNSALELSHTGGMLSALKNIEASMGGLANIVFRTNGITDGSNFNVNTGKFDSTGSALSAKGLSILPQDSFTKKLNNATGKFLFGSSSTSITDGGLQYGGSLSSLQAGNGINQYANVNTTKKGAFGGLFGGNSSVNTTQTQAVSGELSQQFAQIFIGVQAALTSAAVGMGLGADKVTSVLNGLTVASTNVSLKGLSGQALTDAINAVISKSLDEISSAAFPELTSFRKVGEGFAETVVRISADYQNLDSILQSIGGTFGAVGLSSVAARERLLDLAGGVDNLAKQTASFADNYLTEAERLAPVAKYVGEQLAALGFSGIKTRDQFKAAVLGLADSGALATTAGAATYAGLLNIADAFAKVTPAIDSAAIAAQAMADAAARISAIASERTGLETELLNLQGNKAELRKRELSQLDESNRALKQSIYDLQDKQAADVIAAAAAQKAADESQKAAEQAQQAAEQIRTAWQSVTNSLFDEVARIRGMITGNSAESLAGAQAKFSITNAQALSGDQEAAKLLPKLSQALLAIAEQQAPTLEALNRIRASTAGTLESTANSFSRFGANPTSPAMQSASSSYAATANYQQVSLPQVSSATANDTLVNSLIAEVRELKGIINSLVTPTLENERNTRKMKDNIQRVTHDGDEMQSRVLA